MQEGYGERLEQEQDECRNDGLYEDHGAESN